MQQFTRDIASYTYFRELLTFKEYCGIDTSGCGFKQITCSATALSAKAALSAGCYL